MRIFVIGLDCAAPEIVFGNPRLPNLSRLAASGCFGRLESIVPPITVPAWMCMATGLDPGTLGVYGFRNRTSHAYGDLGVVNADSITAPAIWDHLGEAGWRSVVVGVPPGYPPRPLNGVRIGCFLTPDPTTCDFTYPKSIKADLLGALGHYPVDVRGYRTDDKAWLKDQIYDMTRQHFAAIRHLMTTEPWDYFQFVEIGVDRMHHGFWKYHDPMHRQHVPGNPYRTVIDDYYAYLDEEIGQTLELLDDDTAVLVVSDHGAQRLEGGFCVNEWLRREGLLEAVDPPSVPTPLSKVPIDWSRTRVWSEGGYYARVFFNVEGREPNGVIPAAAYEDFLAEMRDRLEATVDDHGRPMGTRVFRPSEIYRHVRNVAPDLIAHFGGLYWRSIGGLGYPTLHVQENDTGPDDCNHAQFGMFILSAPHSPVRGEVTGMHLLDVAPTLLDMADRPVPASMRGRSLYARV